MSFAEVLRSVVEGPMGRGMRTILERVLDFPGLQTWNGFDVGSVIRHAVPVLADDVGRAVWQGPKGFYNPLCGDFGPLRPPFDTMWIEYAMPSRILVATFADPDGPRAWVNSSIQRHATLIQVHPEPDSDGNLETVQLHIVERFGKLAFCPDIAWATITPHGEYLEGFYASLTGEPVGLEIESLSVPPMFAISLMHCKNVKLDEFVRQPTKKSKRTGRVPPPIRFTTIKLPGGASGTRLTSAEAGAPQALHIVRGHFKTFTEEKPLLGKHTGTYWWGWQTRGSAERGAVAKDYEVSPA